MRWKVGIAGQHTVLHQLAIVVSNDDMRLEVEMTSRPERARWTP